MKSEYLNISNNLNNLVINLIFLANNNISDILLINIYSLKYLYSNITEKNSVPDFLVNISDKSSISIILIF